MQHYPTHLLQCVVVDNGSVDGTADAASHFVRKHPDLNVQLVYEATPGVGRAKNTGAALASGDILIFMDADSCMACNLVCEVVKQAAAGWPAGSIRVTADGGDVLDWAFFSLMEFGKVAFGVRGQMMYCRRELFNQVGGFNPNMYLAEDLDFLRRTTAVLGGGRGRLSHVRTGSIATSPRRLHGGRFRSGLLRMFERWFLAFLGFGRHRPY